MPSALAYGLMGAAKGALQGLKQQNDQDVQDARMDRLMQARALEAQQLEAMKAQYQSANNLQRIQQQFGADAALQTQKETADSAKTQAQIGSAQQIAEARDKTALRSAQTSAGARISAANISANATAKARQPTPLGDALYQNKDGSYVVVKSGDTPPANSTPIQSGSSFGAAQFVMPAGLLGGLGAPTPPSTPAPSATPPPAPGARQAPDGNWYVSDPKNPGKYLKVN